MTRKHMHPHASASKVEEKLPLREMIGKMSGPGRI